MFCIVPRLGLWHSECCVFDLHQLYRQNRSLFGSQTLAYGRICGFLSPLPIRDRLCLLVLFLLAGSTCGGQLCKRVREPRTICVFGGYCSSWTHRGWVS